MITNHDPVSLLLYVDFFCACIFKTTRSTECSVSILERKREIQLTKGYQASRKTKKLRDLKRKKKNRY